MARSIPHGKANRNGVLLHSGSDRDRGPVRIDSGAVFVAFSDLSRSALREGQPGSIVVLHLSFYGGSKDVLAV